MSGSGPAVDVVIVAYGSPGTLAGALAALGGSQPVVVVDNSSSPDTARLAAAAGARYVDSGANLGFGAAVNLAVEHLGTSGHDLLLLNPDARITPESLARLHELLVADDGLACVAPAQHGPSGGATRARWPWHTPAAAWLEAAGLARRRLASPRYFLGGAVLLVRRRAWDDVGPFDPRYFLYAEDEDWQRRALARGWRVRLCPEVDAEHAGGASEHDPERLRLRLHAATERYIRKWYGPGGWALYRAGVLAGVGARLVLLRGARRRTWAALGRIYLAGPDRAACRAGALPGPAPRHDGRRQGATLGHRPRSRPGTMSASSDTSEA
ncbi:MAG TPA: glycosyltransferase family 2 protein [Acidimicrobiales bacterium]|nr:glycosyltransferase family 2 protein [Acidimicrobiales bacterium]